MPSTPSEHHAGQTAACKLITGIIPDDGTAQNLIKALKSEKDIITANMFQCRGISSSDDNGVLGRLPPAKPVQVVTVVVPAERADELFDYICELADIFRPHGGLVYQSALQVATDFSLPEDLHQEQRIDSARRSGIDRRGEPRGDAERRSRNNRRTTDR